MAAAYGLYTHIQSNKRRSIALLLGLFFLVYLMVFAGALLARLAAGDELLTAARYANAAAAITTMDFGAVAPIPTPDQVRAAGGRFDVVNLPQAGIKGNSHMMMMDKNNLQVADVIQGWLEKQGLYK